MSYSAPNALLMPMRHSIDTMTDSWLPGFNVAITAGAWPSANLAIYIPLCVVTRVVGVKFWFGSGTTGTGNVDVGLYDGSGSLIASAGATAKVASNADQVIDVTNFTVGPGLYYIALVSDSATDTFYRASPAAPLCAAAGILTEAAAYPLPSTATMAVDNSLAFRPLVGLLLEGTAT